MRKYKRYEINEMDLTTGSLFKKIPLFSLPLALTTIFQLLYTTIDLFTVNQFGGGSLSMTAIGSNSPMINLIVTLFVSLATGANVVMSGCKGAGDRKKANKVLHTGIIIALISGLFVGIFGFAISPLLLRLMDTPASILSNATLYMRIYFIGLPFLMVYNFGSQMLRALGDSQRPLYILIFSGIVNVIFDFIFVYFLNMDVAGVAVATVISQFVSALFTILYFKNSTKCFVNFRIKELKIDKESLKDILRVGLPAGVQGLCFSIPNVMIQSSLYTISNYSISGIAISQEEIISGAAASAQVEGYIFAIIDSFGVGLISFVGQNIGAKKKENILKSYFSALEWMGITMVVCISAILLFSYDFLSIFISDSADVIAHNAKLAAQQRLYIMSIPYVFNGMMNISAAYLKGMKKSTIPAIMTLFGCTIFRIVFLLTIFKLDYFHTIFWLYAAFPISWIILDIIYVPIIIKQTKILFNKLETSV